MTDRERRHGSFGSRYAEDDTPQDDQQQTPTPVLHVGEVHAELRLHVTDDTLTLLGSQIASMIANAAAQGFKAGLDTAMAAVEAEDQGGPPVEFAAGGAVMPGPADVRNSRAAPEMVLTDEDLRRAHGDS